MIDDTLLERDSLEFDELAQTPKPEHLVPDSIAREREREQFRSRLDGPVDGVVISHTDADGLSSAALLTRHLETTLNTLDVVVKTVDYNGSYQFEHVVEDLLDMGVTDVPIYVSDFALDTPDVVDDLETLADRDCPITWIDHHQWTDDVVDRLEAAGVDVHIDEEECAASLIPRDLGTYPDHLEDLAACTKDIDLWIKDDPRSERLNVFASLVDNPEEYIGTVLDHGADLPGPIQDRIDDRLERDRELEAYAIENRSPIRTIEGYDVVATYSRGGRSSTIGNALVEDLEVADVAIVMKTHGGIGIYSHSDRTGFTRCHEVADRLGGGGHPTAAGCEVPARTFQELAEYWATEGRSVQDFVVGAVHHVASNERLEEQEAKAGESR